MTFGRMRNAVGTWANSRMFPQLFRVSPHRNMEKMFSSSLRKFCDEEKKTTCLLWSSKHRFSLFTLNTILNQSVKIISLCYFLNCYVTCSTIIDFILVLGHWWPSSSTISATFPIHMFCNLLIRLYLVTTKFQTCCTQTIH